MKRRRSTQLEKTAYHEAGHAVAAVLLGVGLKPEGVSIVASGDDSGRCAVDMNDVKWFPFVSICLAGHVAQNLFRPGSSFWIGGARGDLELVTTLLEELRTSKGIEGARWTGSYIQVVQKETKKLLRKQWHVVEAMASALLERKTLVGLEAEAIVKEMQW